MSNFWFTADTHFDHANAILHCKRPQLQPGDVMPSGKWIDGKTANERMNEMNEFLIDIWNNTVYPEDIVYHLGDFCWNSKPERWAEFVDRLNGSIVLIKGNHDMGRKEIGHLFRECDWLKVIRHNKKHITLCHYAMRTWYRSHHGTWQLYGHSHGQLPPIGKQMDVGVDCNDFTPIHIDQIFQIMEDMPDNAYQGEFND